MDVFAWNPLFDTGIALIDGQHRQLVALINRLGEALISGRAGADGSAEVYRELTDYAQHHFADEERLMAAAAVDPVHVSHHCAQHRDFTTHVEEYWRRYTNAAGSDRALHRYLTAWLTFHILEEDQRMARYFHRQRNPAEVDAAGDGRDTAGTKGNALLLASLHQLHRALETANAQLEDQVRTRSLALLQSEKMAAIGKLAAGVAHEINNPLAFINSNVGTLRRYVADLFGVVDCCQRHCERSPELALAFAAVSAHVDLAFLRHDLAALLAETVEGVQRVSWIVSALNDFADETPSRRRATDLLVGLENTLVVVANQLGSNIKVIRHLIELPLVDCEPGQINQVFLNLLVNAVQAVANAGVITLSSGFDADEVWVEIADSGQGIADAHLERVFEPFFTTRPVGSGLGLGLYVAWDVIVNKHGGRINVRNVPGAGAAFTVWLPRASAPDIEAPCDVGVARSA